MTTKVEALIKETAKRIDMLISDEALEWSVNHYSDYFKEYLGFVAAESAKLTAEELREFESWIDAQEILANKAVGMTSN